MYSYGISHPSDCFSRWEQTDLDPDLMTHKPLYSDIVRNPITIHSFKYFKSINFLKGLSEVLPAAQHRQGVRMLPHSGK